MTKKPPAPAPDEDKEQSARFLETARQMQDAGELSPTEDGAAFERLMGKAAPPKRRHQDG
jgi:hypothetical protein